MNRLSVDIEHALRGGANLETLRDVVKRHKDAGLTQDEARGELDSLRFLLHGDLEDLLLEVMDCVTGFCAPDLRIWDDDPPF